jgi:hypothetical protein
LRERDCLSFEKRFNESTVLADPEAWEKRKNEFLDPDFSKMAKLVARLEDSAGRQCGKMPELENPPPPIEATKNIHFPGEAVAVIKRRLPHCCLHKPAGWLYEVRSTSSMQSE